MYSTDTHGLLWHLQEVSAGKKLRRRGGLSPRARRIFSAADRGLETILIPSIVLVELVYMSERGRIPSILVAQLLADLATGPENYRMVPLDLDIVTHLRDISVVEVPEMPDRIIAATAKATKSGLVTRDESLARAAGVSVVW